MTVWERPRPVTEHIVQITPPMLDEANLVTLD